MLVSNILFLPGYDRKKYICKLLYMFMLGYEIDFGHMEAVNLISSDKYSEKHIVCVEWDFWGTDA